MNPSTSGWITKLLKKISENQEFINQSEATLYCSLREAGFLYGNNKSVIVSFIDSEDLTDEEMSKVNLLLALYYTHQKSESELNFLDSIIEFY
jgi:hypothetical protein